MIISTSKHYKLDLPKILISVIFILAVYLYTYLFISRENYIYFYDFGLHYIEFIEISDLLHQSGLLSTLNKVLVTIRTSDYNLLSAFLLSPFSLISTSRLCYLYAIITTFYLPAYWLFLKIIKIINNNSTPLQHFLITSIFFLSPTLLIPILRNESSIDGIFPILLTLYIFLRQFVNKTLNFYTILPLAFLIILPPLLHRWYLPFSLSVLILSPVFSIFYFQSRSKTIYYYFFLSILSVILFLLISQNLWRHFFLVDYVVLYHKYQLGSNLFVSIAQTFSKIGYSVIILFFISAVSLFKKPHLRFFTLYLLGIFFVDIVLFHRIQSMTVHHFYLIIMPIIILISLWISTTKFPSFLHSLTIFIIILYNFIYPSIQYHPKSKPTIFFSTQDTSPWNFPQTDTVLQIISDLSVIKPKSIMVLITEGWLNNVSLLYYTCYFNQNYLPLCPHIAKPFFSYAQFTYPESFIQSDYFLIYQSSYSYKLDPANNLLKLFILQHPEYYQVRKEYFLPYSNTITLYQLTNTPSDKEFNSLHESIKKLYD